MLNSKRKSARCTSRLVITWVKMWCWERENKDVVENIGWMMAWNGHSRVGKVSLYSQTSMISRLDWILSWVECSYILKDEVEFTYSPACLMSFRKIRLVFLWNVFLFLTWDAFVRRNCRAIPMMLFHLSIWDSHALWSYGAR